MMYDPLEVELDLVGIHHYQSGLKNLELSRLFDSVAIPVAVAIVAVGVLIVQVIAPLVLAMRQYYCYQRR
jgi:hypothetical protein